MEYMILDEEAQGALQQTVRHYMRQGWRPVGGVSVVSTPYAGKRGDEWGQWYMQAMTRTPLRRWLGSRTTSF
jgi:hypothetical protein